MLKIHKKKSNNIKKEEENILTQKLITLLQFSIQFDSEFPDRVQENNLAGELHTAHYQRE